MFVGCWWPGPVSSPCPYTPCPSTATLTLTTLAPHRIPTHSLSCSYSSCRRSTRTLCPRIIAHQYHHRPFSMATTSSSIVSLVFLVPIVSLVSTQIQTGGSSVTQQHPHTTKTSNMPGQIICIKEFPFHLYFYLFSRGISGYIFMINWMF